MKWLNRFPKLNTILIILFFCMWLYTEISEQQARVEWQAFTRAGARFTAEDGDDLRARIDHLEEHLDDIH